MSEWKAGDIVGVRVMAISPSGRVHVRVDYHGDRVAIDPAFIQPLPTDPHQALMDAVVEAAKVYMKEGADVALYRELREAVDAFTATQTPPKLDLVEVFFRNTDGVGYLCTSEGWQACADTPKSCRCRREIGKGLAAVHAARGAK